MQYYACVERKLARSSGLYKTMHFICGRSNWMRGVSHFVYGRPIFLFFQCRIKLTNIIISNYRNYFNKTTYITYGVFNLRDVNTLLIHSYRRLFWFQRDLLFFFPSSVGLNYFILLRNFFHFTTSNFTILYILSHNSSIFYRR